MALASGMVAPFCLIVNTFSGNSILVGIIAAIVLGIGVVMWLSDMGGKGLPIQIFMTVAIGVGLLLGIPSILTGMGFDIETKCEGEGSLVS